ncbi:polyketide synthase dehydratase domain-containing protein [Micromonospora sp. M12]
MSSTASTRAAAAGFHYGPAFRGLRAVWRHGDDILAEVTLPDGLDGHRFGIHPALFDAVLHAIALVPDRGTAGPGRLPFSWSGVRLHATGADTLRVRATVRADDSVSLLATDIAGAPVVSVDALVTREFRPAAGSNHLFRVSWPEITARPGPDPHSRSCPSPTVTPYPDAGAGRRRDPAGAGRHPALARRRPGR